MGNQESENYFQNGGKFYKNFPNLKGNIFKLYFFIVCNILVLNNKSLQKLNIKEHIINVTLLVPAMPP